MKRFEINVGDDFPVDGNGQPAGCGRWRMAAHGPSGMGRRIGGPFGLVGLAARVLLGFALVAIIVRHPVQSALICAIVLAAERFSHLRRHGRRWNGPRWRSDAERGAFV